MRGGAGRAPGRADPDPAGGRRVGAARLGAKLPDGSKREPRPATLASSAGRGYPGVMRPPFPGMDPWLEHPATWPGLHNALIAAIANSIGPRLPESYFVSLEERMVISALWEDEDYRRPDLALATFEVPEHDRDDSGHLAVDSVDVLVVEVPYNDEIRETYLEIRDSAAEGRLITAIEVLSPTNKRPGNARLKYLEKRSRVIHSRSSLVEIDLLRAGAPMPVSRMGAARAAPYRIMISRAWERPDARLHTFGLRTPIPAVSIPLTRGEPEPELDLNPLLHEFYEVARYHLRIDYARPPVPPLSAADDEWARSIVSA